MSNPFAILAEYPENGPEMPQREKVRREKDRHVSGTGRRDKEKRQGRGPSNWGNPMDDVKNLPAADAPQNAGDEAQENEQQPAQEEPKVNYVAAAQFFTDSDDEDEAPVTTAKPSKHVVNVPKEYAGLIVDKKDKNIQIQKEDQRDDEDDENRLETGFLNTKEAIAQRRDNNHFDSRGRGGRGGQRGRGGRGGRGHYNGPRGQADGENRPRGGHPGQRGRGQRKFQHYEDVLNKEGQHQEGQQQEGERRPRDQNKTSRDKRPGNVQHQRDNTSRNQRQSRQSSNLNLNNFPSLK